MYNNVLSTRSSPEKKEYILALDYEFSDAINSFKLIPSHEKHFVPMSEYLYKFLQPELDDNFYFGKDYEDFFDYFEIFFSLVFADLHDALNSFFYAPVGRFTWKYKRSYYGSNNLKKIFTEADKLKDNWEPLKQGFFNGSFDRFKEIYEKYTSWIAQFAWH